MEAVSVMGDFATREDLRELGRDIVAQMNRRFDEQREVGAHLHQQNIDRLDYLGEQTARTNGRVTILEQTAITLAAEFQAIRGRWHAFRDSLQADVAKQLAGMMRGTPAWDDVPMTRKELAKLGSVLIAAMSLTAVVTIWLMTRMPKP